MVKSRDRLWQRLTQGSAATDIAEDAAPQQRAVLLEQRLRLMIQ